MCVSEDRPKDRFGAEKKVWPVQGMGRGETRKEEEGMEDLFGAVCSPDHNPNGVIINVH